MLLLTQIVVRPQTLIGTSDQSLTLPLPDGGSVEVGRVTVALDRITDEHDGGVADLTNGEFQVSFGVQVQAPGLYDLVTKHGFDPTSVGPVRAIASWQGRYTTDGELDAVAHVEILPGSLWAGATAATTCSGVCSDCGTIQGEVPILQLVQAIGDERESSTGHVLSLACPCPFQVTFPPELGGGTMAATIRGVLVCVASAEEGQPQEERFTARLTVLESDA